MFVPLLDGAVTEIPVVGPLLDGHDALVYLAVIVAGVASYYLFHTHLGLSLRAVGEDSASAESAGVNVTWVRYAHVMVGGALAGLGGAYFSLALVPTWQDDPIGAAGWIAMLPFVLATVAIIVLTSGKRARFLGAPAALGILYFREQR